MNAPTTRRASATPAAGNGGLTPSWPGDPEGIAAEDIDFEALAHVLGNTCRWGGRTLHYHSLAAHAVIASEEIEALGGLNGEDRRALALHALLAEAPAAWTGSAGGPAPARPSERIRRQEAAIGKAVREAAGLDAEPSPEQAELLRFVLRMTDAAERRDLAVAGAGEGSKIAFPPLRRRIRTVGPGRAARLWLARLEALKGPPGNPGAEAAKQPELEKEEENRDATQKDGRTETRAAERKDERHAA